jgi:hypothetical protein
MWLSRLLLDLYNILLLSLVEIYVRKKLWYLDFLLPVEDILQVCN